MGRHNRSGTNALAVKSHNMRVLLLALLRQQPISRIRLARSTGLSTTTVTNLTAGLLDQGVIEEVGTDVEARALGAGRPPLALRLVPSSRSALGIHIGVRRARVALVDLWANILAVQQVELTPGAPVQPMLDSIIAAARDILDRCAAAPGAGSLVGVGVGASGLVQVATGVNLFAPNLGWRDVPLRAIFAEQLNLPAVVDNNVRCMALAESLYGVGRNRRALAFVYARVGVGAGLVVDGEVYRGADYGAGEIGHWVMIPHGGARCRCGNSGCLETLISETVLVEQAAHLDPDLVAGHADPLPVLLEAARGGHLALIELLEERAHYTGLALANLVNVLNPQLIFLGGWLQEAFDLVEPIISRTMRQHAFGGLGARVEILPATFGKHSGAVGAAALALESFFFTPQLAG